MTATAELIADRGEAVAGNEFFRSRPFFDAEEVTHTLRIEGDGADLLAPVIVRGIPGAEGTDAISPYGYPGFEARGSGVEGLDPDAVDFSSTGLVSLFIRHALGAPPLASASERNVVQIADPELPMKRRSSDRNQINKNRRNGYEVRIVPGAETGAEDRAGFRAAYEETMKRAGAAERYFFAASFFERILDSPAAWLALVDGPDGGVAAGSVTVLSDGFIHYYLSGSTDAHLPDSPMKNLVAALVDFSSEREMPLNLGGGIGRGDRLEEFKRGFANREELWWTSEIVCDTVAYSRLSVGRAAGDFFPAYRAPA